MKLRADSKFLVILGFCFCSTALLAACAHKQVSPPAVTVAPPDVGTALPAPSENPAVEDDSTEKKIDDQVATDQPMPTVNPEADAAGWVTTKLADVKKISIQLPYADVRLSTGASKKHATLRVRVWPQGGASDVAHGTPLKPGKTSKCDTELDASADSLQLSEAKNLGRKISGTLSGALHLIAHSMPASFECKYEVEVDAAEATDIAVKLTRGTVAAEHWKKDMQVDLDWGDIDVGTVGPLTVHCGRCTVAGEDVAGAFNFKINNGNVGIVGLEGPVVGETLGDLVLKWKRLPLGSQVKLKSRAGDVVLSLPKGVPLAMALKTPRGESSIGEMTSSDGGVPLDVTAEIGNIRLYRH